MPDISIVTDSTADLPDDLSRRYGIQVVRNIIMIDGKSYQDGEDITREEFYQLLPRMEPFPTTATASSGVYNQIYTDLFKKGAKRILSIHPPGNLSGIINAARIAAEDFGNRIHVMDSGQLSLGLGFQVLSAAEQLQQGSGLEMVIQGLESMQRRIHLIAMLDTLEYMRRSGRVSWARARLGNLLQIKPFVKLEYGMVASLGESRTRNKGVQRLKDFLSKIGKLERLAILHTNAESDARKFLYDLPEKSEVEPLIINVNTVIGAHVGPNGLGFVAVSK